MAYISFQPKDYFNTKLYTGTGSSNVLTGIGFQSDLIWTSTRNTTEIRPINDSVNGINNYVMNSKLTNVSNVLISIPITTNPGGYIYYKNPFENVRLTKQSGNKFTNPLRFRLVKLQDQETPIDFNNETITFTLKIYKNR